MSKSIYIYLYLSISIYVNLYQSIPYLPFVSFISAAAAYTGGQAGPALSNAGSTNVGVNTSRLASVILSTPQTGLSLSHYGEYRILKKIKGHLPAMITEMSARMEGLRLEEGMLQQLHERL